MKNLLLLATLLLSITVFSQKPGADLSLKKDIKRAFSKGKYSKAQKFLTKKLNCKKYVIDGYDIFKNDYLGDYNYVFNNIDSEAKYYQTIHYSLTNFLNPERRVNYEVYDNFTAMCQSDEEGNYHIVFILRDSPQN